MSGTRRLSETPNAQGQNRQIESVEFLNLGWCGSKVQLVIAIADGGQGSLRSHGVLTVKG